MRGFFARLIVTFLKSIGGISAYVAVPGTPRLAATREEDSPMPSSDTTPTFSYTIQAPAFSDPTADKLTFYATVAGIAQPPVVMQPGQSLQAIVGVPLGASVDCWFTESDASNNESGPGPHLTFTAVDDVPPAPPSGAPVVVSHVEVMPATPTPAPAGN